MASHPNFSLFLLCFSLLLSTLPSALSRSLTSSSHTQLLNVDDAIARTFHILSSNRTAASSASSSLEHVEQSTGSTQEELSSFSLSLHPRASLTKSSHKDYASLTRARLARDEARVSSITTKLNLALAGISHADLKPVETSVQPEDLQAPVTSGTTQGSGEYFARLGVGQPVKEFYMVIDTGSDVNWLQCEPCSDCYQQTDPVYNPSSSSTYSPLTCTSPQCTELEVQACRADSCLYQVSYGDGSFTTGDFITETVSFGKSGAAPSIAIGCGHDNEGLFVAAAGLLGLGGGALSLPSQIKAKSFSYCLVNRDSSSSSTLDFNAAPPSDSVLAPLLRNGRVDTYFYVGLKGISVGDQVLTGIPASFYEADATGQGGIIVDSGTAITRLRTEAYNGLRDAFVARTKDLPMSDGFALFDTCYDLSGRKSVSVPTVGFIFSDGKKLMLKPENYLIPVDSTGKFCLAFAPSSSLSIIGNVQQQGTRVSYDLANKVVGFSPNKC